MMSIMNNPELVGFYALSAVAIFASLRVIILANPVHAILSMIVTLLAIAGIFFIIGASFAGALEIVVYAGAILILFVFVIMMLNLGMANDAREERWLDAKTWAVPTGLTVIIAVIMFAMVGFDNTSVSANTDIAVIGGISVPAKAVGTVLFSKYILLVEIAALLLLAALVAAYHLGKESIDDEIVGNDSLNFQPSVGSINIYDHESSDKGMHSATGNSDIDGVQMAEPYEYKDVDPYDYVGKSISKSVDNLVDRSENTPISRKESN